MAVITKIDLVNEHRRQEIKDTVRDFLGSNGFMDVPIILASNKTGEGLDNVRDAINQLVAQVQHNKIETRAFRMNIERSFSPLGVGAVVTGIPSCGSVAVRREVGIVPWSKTYTCRAVQKYGHECASSPGAYLLRHNDQRY